MPADVAAADMSAAGLEPLEPYPGAGKPWRCQCRACGREVAPRLADIKRGQGSCVYCPGRRVSDLDAEAQMRAAGLDPIDPYPGSMKPWRCICRACGNEVAPRLDSIRLGQGGCRHCAQVASGEAQRVPESEAIATMRAAGLEPLEPYSGSNAPWRCRCTTCGNEVAPLLGSVRHRGTGCRYCAPYGVDPAAPGLVYVLHHDGFGAHKVGIANQTSQRTQRFATGGWVTFRSHPLVTAADAYRVEQAVLAPYRETRICPFLTRAEIPDGGWTETIDAEAVSLLDLWAEVVAAADALVDHSAAQGGQRVR